MPHDNIIVEVGQIWIHPGYPGEKYEIVEIRVETHFDRFGFVSTCRSAFAAKYVDGVMEYARRSFGPLTSDLKPYFWGEGWQVDEGSISKKTFSRIGSKFLKKRMREQIAGSILTEKS